MPSLYIFTCEPNAKLYISMTYHVNDLDIFTNVFLSLQSLLITQYLLPVASTILTAHDVSFNLALTLTPNFDYFMLLIN